MVQPTSIRLPNELKARLQERARQEHRRVSNLIVHLLDEATKDDRASIEAYAARKRKDDDWTNDIHS